ncbi:DinB family protein [Fredinandcohnia sp. 179-A 10B2 NHS]|uniref:DinB family protein n=1 Tax=Fredinandcohnia sp. 179-A 10B2 NHS TaxID=3235176 RepID=UPI0039A3558A
MIEINNQIREELLSLVEGLTDEQLNTCVEEGSWTIAQVLEHLYLLEKSVTNLIQRKLESATIKPVVTKPLKHTLNRSLKIDAPSFLVPKEDFLSLIKIKGMLKESRVGFLKSFEGVERSLLEQKSYVHPIFGDLNLAQWIEFIGLHEQRHMEQIKEIKEKL